MMLESAECVRLFVCLYKEKHESNKSKYKSELSVYIFIQPIFQESTPIEKHLGNVGIDGTLVLQVPLSVLKSSSVQFFASKRGQLDHNQFF